MATKVFSAPDFLFAASIGVAGVDVAAAATQITTFNGTATWTQTTDADTGGTGVTILVIGSLIDDASVPPVITLTNVHVEYDWTLAALVPVPLPQDSLIGDDALAANIPTGTQTFSGSGSGGGHVSDDVQNLATYYGGTSRADLFAKPIAWTALNNWGPGAFAAHGRSCGLTNYTLTVTYTTPVVPEVISISPNVGSVDGGQTVTITGLGFTGAPGATVGGVALTSFVVVDDEHITGVTGAHLAGVVDVEVTGVGTLTGGYTYAVDVRRLPPMPSRTPMRQGGGARGR